jgi:hypothetical protein
LVENLQKNQKYFVVSKSNFREVMVRELNVAPITGIPFRVSERRIIHPLTKVNLNELCFGAPKPLISLLDNIVGEVIVD